MMSSKGAHILVEAMISLRRQGVYVEGCIAGDSFQAGYKEYLEEQVRKYQIENIIFTGQLTRSSLARWYDVTSRLCVPINTSRSVWDRGS